MSTLITTSLVERGDGSDNEPHKLVGQYVESDKYLAMTVSNGETPIKSINDIDEIVRSQEVELLLTGNFTIADVLDQPGATALREALNILAETVKAKDKPLYLSLMNSASSITEAVDYLVMQKEIYDLECVLLHNYPKTPSPVDKKTEATADKKLWSEIPEALLQAYYDHNLTTQEKDQLAEILRLRSKEYLVVNPPRDVIESSRVLFFTELIKQAMMRDEYPSPYRVLVAIKGNSSNINTAEELRRAEENYLFMAFPRDVDIEDKYLATQAKIVFGHLASIMSAADLLKATLTKYKPSSVSDTSLTVVHKKECDIEGGSELASIISRNAELLKRLSARTRNADVNRKLHVTLHSLLEVVSPYKFNVDDLIEFLAAVENSCFQVLNIGVDSRGRLLVQNVGRQIQKQVPVAIDYGSGKINSYTVGEVTTRVDYGPLTKARFQYDLLRALFG